MDRQERAACLRRVVSPRSIAVVGASDRNFYGRTVLENLRRHGYAGTVVPVNPRATEVQGLPCYASLTEAPPVDLVVIAVGRDHVLPTIEEAAGLGVAGAVVLTSGLAETGDPEWVAAEAKAADIADKAGMAMIGPNGLGVIGHADGAYAFGAPTPWPIPSGKTALIMESGGLLCGSLAAISSMGVGLDHAASIGNGGSIDVADWVEALTTSPNVDTVGLMLEAMPPWEAFSAAVRTARSNGKTFYAVKTGKSEAGARAAATHTGALAGSYATASDLLEQLGVRQSSTMSGLMTALALQSTSGSPGGSNLAVFAASGGAVGAIADACAERDVDLGPFAGSTQESLTGLVGILEPSNPLDVGGQALSKPDEFEVAVKRVLADPGIGAVLYVPSLGLPGDTLPNHQDLLARVASAARSATKPVIVTQLTYTDATTDVIREYRKAPNLIITPTVEAAIDGLAPWLASARPERAASIDAVVPTSSDPLLPAADGPDEREIKTLLASRGVPVPNGISYVPGQTPASLDLGRSVLKGISPGVTHKSRFGLVALDLATIDDVGAAEREIIAAAEANGISLPLLLLEEMAPAGTDVFVSLSEQPSGTVLTLGRGGTDVEDDPEVGFLGLPATTEEKRRFVRTTAHDLTEDLQVQLLGLIDTLADAFREERFTVLECNPVRVHDGGVQVLDGVATRRSTDE